MVGNKQYETKGYLSNQNSVSDYFLEVVNWSDYYPFGMEMPGRSYNSGDYRYSFQNQESAPAAASLTQCNSQSILSLKRSYERKRLRIGNHKTNKLLLLKRV